MSNLQQHWRIAVLCCTLLSAASVEARTIFFSNTKTANTASFTLSDNELSARVKNLNLPMEARLTTPVRTKIRRYVTVGSLESQDLLGRTALYFPVFEHYLRVYDLPQSLKYLPLVESRLLPQSVSPASAAGLWQFMPATARSLGLHINGSVDERLDTHRSTEAAVKMLAELYERYDDWALALAAYNCGPARVNSAIRRAGNKRDYWAIQRFLPRESQLYVPAFIAAAYLVEYHDAHQLTPNYPSFQLQETRTFRIYGGLSLYKVAKSLGIDYNTLKELNPGFLRGAVPRDTRGYYVVIPASSATLFSENYVRSESKIALPNGRFRSHYVTLPGDDFTTLTMLFSCSAKELMRWNNLRSPDVTVNQPLLVFLPEMAGPPYGGPRP